MSSLPITSPGHPSPGLLVGFLLHLWLFLLHLLGVYLPLLFFYCWGFLVLNFRLSFFYTLVFMQVISSIFMILITHHMLTTLNFVSLDQALFSSRFMCLVTSLAFPLKCLKIILNSTCSILCFPRTHSSCTVPISEWHHYPTQGCPPLFSLLILFSPQPHGFKCRSCIIHLPSFLTTGTTLVQFTLASHWAVRRTS